MCYVLLKMNMNYLIKVENYDFFMIFIIIIIDDVAKNIDNNNNYNKITKTVFGIQNRSFSKIL